MMYCVLQIRDGLDGRIYFLDRRLGDNKATNYGALFANQSDCYYVTADEYIEVMIWIYEKNYSLVKCVMYNTLRDAVRNFRKDFYKV